MATKKSGRAAGQPSPIEEVLLARGPLAPEQLFELAGFDDDSVEDFYEQLRGLVASGVVLEHRPNKADVTLEATGLIDAPH